MNSQTVYVVRPTRKRTLSLTSSSTSSIPSRITLDFSNAELATVTLHTRSHSAYGSFTPTPSALPTLHHLKRASAHPNVLLMQSSQHLQISPRSWVEEEVDSPLSSSFPSPLIPSFSRTASIPDSPMISTRASSTLVEPNQTHLRERSSELDPIFAKLERKSKLLTKNVYCSTCNKVGSDYPKCGKCDAMWCSRECRMFRGKRHVCSPRT